MVLKRDNLRLAGGRRRASRRRGFTLIEAALTTVIIGTGVLAILAAQQAYHKKNDWAGRESTAMLLANELRELTMVLPMHDPLSGADSMGPETNENSITDYDDLDDFAGEVDENGIGSGLVFSPPVNALRAQIGDLEGWTQEIKVENVLPDNISSTFTQPLGTTDLMRVTVTIKYRKPTSDVADTITSLTWLVAR